MDLVNTDLPTTVTGVSGDGNDANNHNLIDAMEFQIAVLVFRVWLPS